MLSYLRYALATVCFTLGVFSLALWGSGNFCRFGIETRTRLWSFDATHGMAEASATPVDPELCPVGTPRAITAGGGTGMGMSRTIVHFTLDDRPIDIWFQNKLASNGSFGAADGSLIFPLWYAALLFALLGVGALRLGQRFTVRSAIIAMTAVAGLLGIVVAV
ncbi:hypothetical protein [Lacipirellula parvula]|uniref:Uncharacterized protein n=1 Tax=Lacipirellula parvula TaxID=2650471 RepID=A0A5K7XEP7_9BACT|nr:hypothetical protein [Lacipirellula parvula]BBO32703.1 hypothetical protein PLANPX_2315 [Lacipirellula parvula]